MAGRIPAHRGSNTCSSGPGPRPRRRRVASRRMTPRSLARLQATGRVVLGAGIAAAPSLIAGGWVGAVADKPGGRALAIGLGARDVGIALGTAAALRNGYGARAW